MLKDKKTPLFILAPMDDVTDTVFRQVVASCAPPDLCFSEFVNVDGLMSRGRSRLIHKLDWRPIEAPLVAHIWGLNPDNFYKIADQIASGEMARELGLNKNYVGIDLNMGCPSKQVIKTGACSGLINDQDLAKEIIAATKQGASNRIPVSVKTRIGFNSIDESWTQFLFNQDLSMLSVHLRTTKEMSLVEAHLDELKRIKAERDSISPATLLIANGDIKDRIAGQKIIDKYGIDGVMIGRGIFNDPYAFSGNSPWPEFSRQQKIDLFIKHIKLIAGWQPDPDRSVKRLNKYAKIYINGFDGAKELREQIAAANKISELLAILG